MVNYNNGKIYKIESNIGDKVYIGSTTKEYLSQRMTAHRTQYSQWKQGKIRLVNSFLLFDEYGIDNCSIILLEACVCSNKDELHAREAHYIRSIACVNKMIPGRTKKEWDEDNKDKNKKYYVDNKERIQQYKDNNKEWIHARDNAHYHANKDEINRKKRERRAANKEQNDEIYNKNKDKNNEQRRIRRAAKKLEQQSTQ